MTDDPTPNGQTEPVVDLMAALRESVDRAKAQRRPVPPAPSSDTPGDECDVIPSAVGRCGRGTPSCVADHPAPSTPVPEASERAQDIAQVHHALASPRLPLGEALPAADAFGRIVAALPAPSSSPVGDRPWMEPSAVVDALEAMSARLTNITGTQAAQLLVAADYVRLHIAAAADRGEPTT